MEEDTEALNWLAEKEKKHAGTRGFTRLHNCIIDGLGKTCTIADVCRLSEAEWYRVPNFGKKSLELLRLLLDEDGLTLYGQVVQIRDHPQLAPTQVRLAVIELALKDMESIKAERDLLKARQKAIYEALRATEFDEDKPRSQKPPPPDCSKWEQRIAELGREVKSLKARANARAQILWLIVRAAGGIYSFDAKQDPSGLGECPSVPAVSIDGRSNGGVMTVSATSAGLVLAKAEKG